MLMVIAIVWLGFSGLYAVGGLRGVFWVIFTVIAFVGMGLIGGGVVEVARGMGIEIYGNGPGDQESFYNGFMLVTLVIASVFGLVEVKKVNYGEKRRAKKRTKMQSFLLWQKPKGKLKERIKL